MTASDDTHSLKRMRDRADEGVVWKIAPAPRAGPTQGTGAAAEAGRGTSTARLGRARSPSGTPAVPASGQGLSESQPGWTRPGCRAREPRSRRRAGRFRVVCSVVWSASVDSEHGWCGARRPPIRRVGPEWPRASRLERPAARTRRRGGVRLRLTLAPRAE